MPASPRIQIEKRHYHEESVPVKQKNLRACPLVRASSRRIPHLENNQVTCNVTCVTESDRSAAKIAQRRAGGRIGTCNGLLKISIYVQDPQSDLIVANFWYLGSICDRVRRSVDQP